MPTSFARATRALSLFISLFVVVATVARADLTWHPDTGWKIEGGVLEGIAGPEGQNARNLMNKARDSEEAGHKGSALRTYKKVAKRYPGSVYAAEALHRSGKLYLSRKQYFKSFDSFSQVILRYPNTTHFNEIIGEEYRIASALLDGARNRWFGIIPGFKNQTKALEYFATIIRDAPYSDYAPLALMNMARGHLKERDFEEAIDALDHMINNYPQSLLAPDAYLKLAQTHALLVEGPSYDQGSTKEAITYFEDFLILFPNDANIPAAAAGLDKMKKVLAESKMTIGNFYLDKRSNYAAARVFYNEAITTYPESDVAVRAKQKLVEVEAKASGKPLDPSASPKKKKRFFFF
jgi:outer membrane protein assembly factor BamD